jgi:uncharacterized protein (TIRG00374 family)
MKRFLYISLQVGLIAGIFGFLFWNAAATDTEGKNIFTVLCEQPKRWHFLAAAFLIQLFAVAITFIRWRWLVRTLGLECSRRDAFRLGFLGLMLNLAPLGIVGGDAVKAVLIAQKNPDYKSQAVASVFIDRLLGLLVMFICGSLFIVWTGFYARPEIVAQTFTHIVFAFTAMGILGTGIVFLPFFAKGHFERLIEKIPFCGNLLSKLVRSLLLYRNHKRCLLLSCLITIFVHTSFGMSLYWAAMALFPSAPDGVHHIMLHNVTNLTSMIPLAAGPYELVLEQLYQLYGKPVGMGLVVSLMFRLTTIGVAVAGIIYYYAANANKIFFLFGTSLVLLSLVI